MTPPDPERGPGPAPPLRRRPRGRAARPMIQDGTEAVVVVVHTAAKAGTPAPPKSRPLR
jgi:hypothetical protein